MIANGHVEAWNYPLGMVLDEVAIATERENRRLASEAISLKMAATAVMVEDGNEHFKQMIDKLIGDE